MEIDEYEFTRDMAEIEAEMDARLTAEWEEWEEEERKRLPAKIEVFVEKSKKDETTSVSQSF